MNNLFALFIAVIFFFLPLSAQANTYVTPADLGMTQVEFWSMSKIKQKTELTKKIKKSWKEYQGETPGLLGWPFNLVVHPLHPQKGWKKFTVSIDGDTTDQLIYQLYHFFQHSTEKEIRKILAVIEKQEGRMIKHDIRVNITFGSCVKTPKAWLFPGEMYPHEADDFPQVHIWLPIFKHDDFHQFKSDLLAGKMKVSRWDEVGIEWSEVVTAGRYSVPKCRGVDLLPNY